ncbi:MAG TPA: ABC transporter permease [Opitutaceae bacterium]
MLADVKFALRQLAKSPSFTIIALLTLSIGIGSTTVVFSAIDAFRFKPLPHLAAIEDRLLHVAQVDRVRDDGDRAWSYPDFLALRDRTRTLEAVWTHADRTVILAGANRPERRIGSNISWHAFKDLGVPVLRGRAFTAADAALDAPAVALISSNLWRERFQSDDEAIGSTVTLNGVATTLVGVMPPGWQYPKGSDVWTPFRDRDDKLNYRDPSFTVRATLKPGMPLATAQTELDTIMAALAREHPDTNATLGARLAPIRNEIFQHSDRSIVLLFGSVFFVLLIACVNVANLLLARATTRSREIAIRLALGAPRRRVIQQLLIESVVLAFFGGVGGLIVGLWGTDAILAALPREMPFWLRFDYDLRVFTFVFLTSLSAALLFGLAPALRVSKPDVVNELKEGGRTAELNGPHAARFRNLLVVAEIALALVLLVGAGLMMRSFLALRAASPGYTARHVFTFRTGVPDKMYETNNSARTLAFFAALLPRLRAIPGVESAGLGAWRPGLHGGRGMNTIVPEGQAVPTKMSGGTRTFYHTVSPGYFATLKIPLIAGRDFDSSIDKMDAMPALVVDEAFATRHFGSPAAAIGRTLTGLDGKVNVEKTYTARIVGVVATVRHQLDKPDSLSTIYVPVSQFDHATFLTAFLRSQVDPATLAAACREATLAANRDIPIYDDFLLDDLLIRAEPVWQLRFFSYLFTVFGLIALFLACIGIYGVMSYSVTQRIQELGVRLALGAEPRQVIRLVLQHGASLVVCGLVVGLVAAFLLTQLLAGLLYEISPRDPPTFALVPLLLAAVALAACWLSSRRVTLIDPNAAIRMS